MTQRLDPAGDQIAQLSGPTKRRRALLVCWALDLLVVLLPAWLIASLLGIEFLLSHNLPTGGDSASHLLYAWTYAHELLAQGQITGWMPEVFGGTPFLSYYFPLAFISIAALTQVMAFAPAMKIGMCAAAMALPGTVWLGSVYLLRLRRSVAIWGVLSSLAFLLHEQNSIWGGNLLSTLAGEFAYSYGLLFALLTLFAWQRAIATGRHWWLAALLEAATGFSHAFALLISAFASAAFLFDRQHFWRNLRLLACGHALAFFLLAGWLWPMLQMHGITIPNDALFEVTRWQELLPQPLVPVLGGAALASVLLLLLHAIPALRRLFPDTPDCRLALRQAGFMACTALLGVTGFLAGSRIGVANIRFFPFVWLFGGLACAWVWGVLLLRLAQSLNRLAQTGLACLCAACALALLSWISLTVVAAPDWGLWNHSGLEAKPMWQRLTQVFPKISGNLNSARLLFEHDPANSDIGSTRALEALPMFLGQRPVLEGLYMESTLLSPAVYQLQSEVSRHPSSPLARFPSASLDLDMAAEHMNFMFTNQVLIRNAQTQRAFAASAAFAEVASAAPFYVYQLKQFNSHLVDLVDQPLRWLPTKNWMNVAFQWFRSRTQFKQSLPVFYDGTPPQINSPPSTAALHKLRLTRDTLSWRTDAPGAAHLVRMAWHPRWRLASKGQLYLAAPGFMLVVPQEAEVRLEYAQTSLGLAGMLATLLSLLLLCGLIWQALRGQAAPRAQAPSVTLSERTQAPATSLWPRTRLALLWPLGLLALSILLQLNNPERLYSQAWQSQRANRHEDAAALFDRAYAARTSEAKKEEALFWAAKAYQQAGQHKQALQRYRELTSSFDGYWLPESLYTQAQLATQLGQTAEVARLRQRLLLEYPNNRWAQRLRQESP